MSVTEYTLHVWENRTNKVHTTCVSAESFKTKREAAIYGFRHAQKAGKIAPSESYEVDVVEDASDDHVTFVMPEVSR